MKNTINYAMIKDLYGGDLTKIASYLYKHYYYIVDKFYNKNNGAITKDKLERVLIKSISEYVCKDYFNCNPSSYIHTSFINYEKKYKCSLKQDNWELIINKAFNKDIKAREEVLKSFMSIMDYKSIQLNNSQYEIDDIKQMIYLEMWIFINKYFDSDNKDNNLSLKFHNYLNRVCDKINNSNINSFCDANINNIYYSDSYFIERVENNCILDDISKMLSDKEKAVLNNLRKGYTYEDTAKKVGLTKQSVGNMNNKIRTLVKKKDIKW